MFKRMVSCPLAAILFLAAAPLLADPPAGGFSVLGTSPSGKTLFVQLPPAASIQAAIIAAADAFAPSCDGKPVLTSAFEDSQSKHRGGALFTASVNHTPVHGWIFASTAPAGASASVIYLADNAPGAEAQTLFAALPADPKTHTVQFPDGSGSIDLPDGWSTKTQSLGSPVGVYGPHHQFILINAVVQVQTPNGQMVQMMNRTYQTKVQIYNMLLQRWRQTHVGPPPQNPGPPPDPAVDAPNLIFCPYCKTADDVLNNLVPLLQARSRAAGNVWAHVDKVLDSAPADPNPGIPNGHVGIVYYAMTNHDGDTSWKSRAIGRFATWPLGPNGDPWTADLTQLSAPDATFDRDLPVMVDIEDSLKVNDQWLAAKTQAETAAMVKQSQIFRQNMQRQSDIHQKQLAASADNFNHYESQVAARAQARHDANSDFIEMIKGVRDVYDTQTGQMQSTDLSTVNAVTGSLNDAANNPRRFVQIPLRYER